MTRLGRSPERQQNRLASAVCHWQPGAATALLPQVDCIEPILLTLTAGQTYHWCRCGRSRRQPFCDGSHAGSALEPLAFSVKRTQTYWLCACKYTRRPPFCDAAHNRLAELFHAAQA